MTDGERLARFEEMLQAVRTETEEITARMAQLKAQGREKSATYRQLFARRMELTSLLLMYQKYGLTD